VALQMVRPFAALHAAQVSVPEPVSAQVPVFPDAPHYCRRNGGIPSAVLFAVLLEIDASLLALPVLSPVLVRAFVLL
jgi:hypothetical protein